MKKHTRLVNGSCDQPRCHFNGLVFQTIHMDCVKNICKKCIEEALLEMNKHEKKSNLH